VAKRHVEGIEDLSRVLDGAHTVTVPLSSGISKGWVVEAALGDVLLTAGAWTADIRTRGGIASSRISLGVKLDSESTHFSFRSGKEVVPGEVYALTRGDAVDYRVTGPIRYAFVSLSPALLRQLAGEDAQRGNAEFWEERRWFRASEPVRSLITASIERFVSEILQSRRTLTGPALCQMESELVEPFLWGFLFDERNPDERHALTGAAIVRRVEDWVDGQQPETIQIADLCRALGLSRRTLQRAFTETLGMGPARYLTLKRLIAVRAALRRSDPAATTVTEAALRYGFWELGRFARNYRRMFGERPSQTLNKGMS